MAVPVRKRLESIRSRINTGSLVGIEPELQSIIESEPKSLEANLLLGILLAKQDRAAEAENFLLDALEADPHCWEALAWLGAIKKSKGELLEAAAFLERAVAIQPEEVSTLNLLGVCRLNLGEPGEAIRRFSELTRLQPESASAFHNLGMAYRLLNRREDAANAFIQALKLAPHHADNYLQVFKSLQQLSRWDEAIRYLEEGVLRHPNSLPLTEALAMAYSRLGKSDLADRLFREQIRADPTADIAYASWLQEEGRFQESVEILRPAITRSPNQGIAYRLLAEARSFDWEGTPLSTAAIKILGQPHIDDKARMHLAYAAAKSLEHETRFEKAMNYFDLANDLAYHNYPAAKSFNPEATREDPSMMASVYTEDLLTHMSGLGSESATPIFIVGMIRSGTTLLDQILSSHPEVISAGEQPFWNGEADRIHRSWRENPNLEDLESLSKNYLRAVEMEVGISPRVFTDKMPLNYRHLGLIHCAFPRAKILHIKRNPLDTCLSIYMTFFAGGPNFVYRRENIVTFYRSYLAMMSHWRQVLPQDSFLELDYEKLVEDPETESRRVVEFCGLGWSPACLAHQGGRNVVATPSRWQARQPIYRSSIARWQNYEPWLGEFRQLAERT